MKQLALAAVVLLLATPARAIDIVPNTEPDPFKAGATCEAPLLVSWGGYLYDAPSRFDLVNFPWVTMIWKCRKSGYVSYDRDFDKLTDAEKKRIATFLETHPWRANFDPPRFDSPESQTMLDQMEAVYALRSQTREERAYLLRNRAWSCRNDQKADAYRAKALALHKEILSEDHPTGWDRILTLYVIGYYTWKLGDHSAAEPFFAEARTVEYTNDEGKTLHGSDYINGLIDEVKAGKADDATHSANKPH